MAWTYRIDEIQKPGLNVIRLKTTLKKDGNSYVSIAAEAAPEELQGLTNNQKLTLFEQRIKEQASRYILTDNVVSGMESLLGTERSAE